MMLDMAETIRVSYASVRSKENRSTYTRWRDSVLREINIIQSGEYINPKIFWDKVKTAKGKRKKIKIM